MEKARTVKMRGATHAMRVCVIRVSDVHCWMYIVFQAMMKEVIARNASLFVHEAVCLRTHVEVVIHAITESPRIKVTHQKSCIPKQSIAFLWSCCSYSTTTIPCDDFYYRAFKSIGTTGALKCAFRIIKMAEYTLCIQHLSNTSILARGRLLKAILGLCF